MVTGHKKARQGKSLPQGTVNGSRVNGRRRQVQAQSEAKIGATMEAGDKAVEMVKAVEQSWQR